MNKVFDDTVNKIQQIGLDWHYKRLISNSKNNLTSINHSIYDLDLSDKKKKDASIIISAGPSLQRNNSIEKIKNSNFDGSIISIDASYIKCLKLGLIPDYVVTMDPHPTRLVRWFGDPNYKENFENDDYFSRQDLNLDFRKNDEYENLKNIELVNKFASKTKLIICCTSSANVVDRCKIQVLILLVGALSRQPEEKSSITKEINNITKICLNTEEMEVLKMDFCSCFGDKKNAVVGMDLGYIVILHIK